MELKRSVRLILKTTDLTVNSSTNIGTCNQYINIFTFNNINLRMLMGDMYNQYDYFNLLLNTVSCSAAQAGLSEADRFIYIKMTGLPFINQTYQQSTGNNGQYVYVTTYTLPTTAINTNQYYNNPANVITFNKNQDLCNLTFSLNRVSDDKTGSAILPNFTFFFTIVGIDTPDNPDRINQSLKL